MGWGEGHCDLVGDTTLHGDCTGPVRAGSRERGEWERPGRRFGTFERRARLGDPLRRVKGTKWVKAHRNLDDIPEGERWLGEGNAWADIKAKEGAEIHKVRGTREWRELQAALDRLQGKAVCMGGGQGTCAKP